MEKYKPVIKLTDMNQELKKDAITIIHHALEKFSNQKDMAEYIKKGFDKKYENGWHCIVGRNFGTYVTHQEGSFIRLFKGQLNFVLFRCQG